jgi:hypothetical protein
LLFQSQKEKKPGLNDLFKIIDINGGPPPLVVEFILLLYSNPRPAVLGKREKPILGTLSLSLFLYNMNIILASF